MLFRLSHDGDWWGEVSREKTQEESEEGKKEGEEREKTPKEAEEKSQTWRGILNTISSVANK